MGVQPVKGQVDIPGSSVLGVYGVLSRAFRGFLPCLSQVDLAFCEIHGDAHSTRGKAEKAKLALLGPSEVGSAWPPSSRLQSHSVKLISLFSKINFKSISFPPILQGKLMSSSNA